MSPYSGPGLSRSVECVSRTSSSNLQSGRTTDDEPLDDGGVIEDRLDELAAEFVDRYRRGVVAGHLPMSRLGDFRIIREIGRGGMGVVYEAEQMSLGRRVAIKALPQLSVRQPELVRRFQREARTAAQLHHTNIVPVFGVGESEGFHYFVMQLIDGISLDSILDHNDGTASDVIASQLVTELDSVSSSISSSGYVSDSFQCSTHGEPSGTIGSQATAKSLIQRSTDSLPAAFPVDELFRDNSELLSLPTHVRIGDNIGATKASANDLCQAASHSCARVESAEVAGSAAVTPDICMDLPVDSTNSDSLSIAQIVDIGIQAAEALQYAHAQGTLHRDIKPGNLMLDQNGVAWVTDFGLAKVMDGDNITHTENVVGTIRYMAPEQFQGQTDTRSDIYSLGLTLYELITRQRAWSATTRSSLINEIMDGELLPVRKLVPNTPRDLETILLKATARDVQHRYQNAGELAEDLRRFAADLPILARRAGPVEKLWRWSRRNPIVATLSLATALSLLMFAGAATIGYAAERQQRERSEATSELALEALDRIFDRFAPGDSIVTSSQSIVAEIKPYPEHAALSPEAARLLEGLLEFYERLASQAGDAPELVLKCARARQRVGDIYQHLGKYGSAIDAYRMAIVDFEGLKSFEGTNAFCSPVVVKAGLLNGIGSCQLMLARQDASRQSHHEAMSLLNGLPDRFRQSPNVRYELARTHCLLARRLRPCESITAQQFTKFAGDRARGLEVVWGRSVSGNVAASGQHHEGDPSRQTHLDEAVSLLEPLILESPDVARYQFLLALCFRESVDRRESGLTPGLNRACKLLKNLVDQHPDVPQYRQALAETYAEVEFHPRRMRPADAELAEANLTLAVQHARQLVEEHPTVPAYTNSLIHIHRRLASIQERHAEQVFGRKHRRLIMKAERNLRSAAELQNSLVRREPDVVAFHLWAASFRNSIARVLRHQDRLAESRQMSEYAIERIAECPMLEGDVAVFAETKAILYRELGETLQDLGHAEEAVDALLSAEDQFDSVTARHLARQEIQ